MIDAQVWGTLLAGGLAGSVATMVVTSIKDARARRRKQVGDWRFLRVEIQFCGAVAAGYRSDDVLAPSYRMPLQAYEHSLPALLSAGAVGEKDAELLVRYYVNAQSFNRGLDYAQIANDRQDRARTEAEARRAQDKARKLAPGEPGTPTHYDRALAVINAHARTLEVPLSVPDLATELRDE